MFLFSIPRAFLSARPGTATVPEAGNLFNPQEVCTLIGGLSVRREETPDSVSLCFKKKKNNSLKERFDAVLYWAPTTLQSLKTLSHSVLAKTLWQGVLGPVSQLSNLSCKKVKSVLGIQSPVCLITKLWFFLRHWLPCPLKPLNLCLWLDFFHWVTFISVFNCEALKCVLVTL